ncbi:hypothetical protein Tco_0551684 [Tanacetum coccineum]
MSTPVNTSSIDSQMHNNIMAAGSKDRPPMLVTQADIQQWEITFSTYQTTYSNRNLLKLGLQPDKEHFPAVLQQILNIKAPKPLRSNATSSLSARQTSIYQKQSKEVAKTNIHLTQKKPKRVKDYAYHKEKMMMCKQAEQGVPLQAEQADWLEDTDEEIDEQELEAHYSYMAKIQDVSPEGTSSTGQPLEQNKNHNGK